MESGGKTEEPKKPKRFPKIRKALKTIALAALALHVGTQGAYWINDTVHAVSPSPQRAEFKKQFGYPIKGWSADLEDNKEIFSIIADVIAREKAECPFELDVLRIESKNYFKKSAIQQACQVFGSGYAGAYTGFLVGDDVMILPDQAMNFRETLHHEIKHDKTHKAMQKHPELRKRWEALSRGPCNESLYLSRGERVCYMIRGLNSLVCDKVVSPDNYLRFVSDYSRTSVHEDIAELCSHATIEDSLIVRGKAIMNNLKERQGNYYIKEKLLLAQEYNLIAREYSEFAGVKSTFDSIWGAQGRVANPEKVKEFLSESSEFLRKHRDSVYFSTVQSFRGCVQRSNPFLKNQEHYDESIKEYTKVLKAQYKHPILYSSALSSLAELYTIKRDSKKAGIFRNAYDLNASRFKEGDIQLPARGVNDFLEAQLPGIFSTETDK